MAFYIGIVFSIAALAAVVLQFWPKTNIRQEQPFLFPLLAMMAIDLVALLAPQPVGMLYKGAILLGLLVSTLAVVFYHIPKTPAYVAMAHFFVVFFLYFVGFTSANRAAIPSPILLLIVASAALFFWLERDALREAQGAFAGFLVLMSLMLWAASEVWVQHRQAWASAAFAGAVLLSVSQIVLLLDRTRKPIPWSNGIVAGTYFLGQWLVAVSIWGLGGSGT
jgi:uncharacterized membrane protein YhhN